MKTKSNASTNLFLAAIALATAASTLLADLNDGLVAYYPFTGNAGDASGNGNPAVTVNATLTADRFGNPNSAYSFDGVGNYIRVPDSAKLDLNSFTLCVWVKPRQLSKEQCFINKGGYGESPSVDCNYYLFLGPISAPNNRVSIFYEDSLSRNWETDSATQLTANSWYFVAARRDAATGELAVFINGAKNTSAAFSATPVTQGQSLWIGAYDDLARPDFKFNGVIDDVRIYNRALSALEIQQLNAQPAPPVLVSTNRPPTGSEIGGGTIPTDNHLKVFTNGSFQANALVYSNRMTIVLTHGWNSNPDAWAEGMAVRLVEKIGPSMANIVAWDWSATASWIEPIWVSQQAPGQGEALGKTLIQSLGTNYSRPIHLIGHSFGTLVNSRAADFLHKDVSSQSLKSRLATPAGAYEPINTQITLLDEAEVAPKIVNALLSQTLAGINNQFQPTRVFYDRPMPKRKAWADNYISLVGLVHDDVANAILTNKLGSLIADHAYAYNWYSNSVWEPAGDSSLVGSRWSFERAGVASPPAPALGSAYAQAFTTSDLDVVSASPLTARLLLVQRLAALAEAVGYTLVAGVKDRLAKIKGVVQTAIQSAVPDDPIAGPLTSAGIWSVQFTMQTSPGGGLVRSGGNNPACVWATVTVPSNAVSMSFDFMLQGDSQNDLFSAAVSGTNVLSIETSLLETNELVNSGLIDITAWAGKEVEVFFGITGGTSTNATVTVRGIRFYESIPPTLSTRLEGASIVLSWPPFAGNVQLQATTELGNPNSWSAVTNVPVLVNFQNTVTNPITGAWKFFRLAPAL